MILHYIYSLLFVPCVCVVVVVVLLINKIEIYLYDDDVEDIYKISIDTSSSYT